MQKLFTEFTSTTAAQWKEQLVKDLKGIDYNTLVWKTNSGIDVQPFYTKENLNDKPNSCFYKK
jgi:methylmalonyl-CoA mutase